MSLEYVPLNVANFAEGKLAAEIDSALADILNRFARSEDGEMELASDKATVSVKLIIERKPEIGGFACSFEEPKVSLPKKINSGVPAVVRDGVFVVATESAGIQLRLPKPNNSQE